MVIKNPDNRKGNKNGRKVKSWHFSEKRERQEEQELHVDREEPTIHVEQEDREDLTADIEDNFK